MCDAEMVARIVVVVVEECGVVGPGTIIDGPSDCLLTFDDKHDLVAGVAHREIKRVVRLTMQRCGVESGQSERETGRAATVGSRLQQFSLRGPKFQLFPPRLRLPGSAKRSKTEQHRPLYRAAGNSTSVTTAPSLRAD